MICQLCKGLSSPQWCDQVTHLKAPLDSTPIYPIALSRSYLCIEHSTWVGWRLFWSLQVVHLSLIARPRTCLMKTFTNTHPCSQWESLAKLRLHVSIASSKDRISSKSFFWSCTSYPWWRSPHDVILHELYEIFIWCKPMGRYLTLHKDTTHTYHGLVHKAMADKFLPSQEIHDRSWYIL